MCLYLVIIRNEKFSCQYDMLVLQICHNIYYQTKDWIWKNVNRQFTFVTYDHFCCVRFFLVTNQIPNDKCIYAPHFHWTFEIKDICIIHFQCCKRMIDNTKCNYIFDNDESNSFCYFH